MTFKKGDVVQFIDVEDDCQLMKTPDHTYTVSHMDTRGVVLEGQSGGFYYAYRFRKVEPTPAFARATDPETSKEAAKSVNVTYLEGKVLKAIQAAGEKGATQDDLVESLGLPSNSITPRFKPLMNKGLVQDSGTARKGHYSGKRQRVMVAPAVTVEVVIAQSRDAVVRGVEKERSRREDFDRMLQAVSNAKTELATAEGIAKRHGFEILERFVGETKVFNPTLGQWVIPPEAAE